MLLLSRIANIHSVVDIFFNAQIYALGAEMFS